MKSYFFIFLKTLLKNSKILKHNTYTIFYRVKHTIEYFSIFFRWFHVLLNYKPYLLKCLSLPIAFSSLVSSLPPSPTSQLVRWVASSSFILWLIRSLCCCFRVILPSRYIFCEMVVRSFDLFELINYNL